MAYTELAVDPLRGELNIQIFISGPHATPLLRRIPKENRTIIDSLSHEYNNIGFTQAGGRFRKRSPEEQAKLSFFAATHGLNVVSYVNQHSNGTYDYPYLQGVVTLDEYLPAASPDKALFLTLALFEDLRKAHSLGLVYGDRWSKNILVWPDNRFSHVDFDLEIYGPPAISFDVAQLAYYVLAGGKEKVLNPLAHILSMNENWFDIVLVIQFLRRHARHFRHSQKYGGVENETNTLIEIIKKKKRSQ